jgi:hypothetical protein
MRESELDTVKSIDEYELEYGNLDIDITESTRNRILKAELLLETKYYIIFYCINLLLIYLIWYNVRNCYINIGCALLQIIIFILLPCSSYAIKFRGFNLKYKLTFYIFLCIHVLNIIVYMYLIILQNCDDRNDTCNNFLYDNNINFTTCEYLNNRDCFYKFEQYYMQNPYITSYICI